MRLRDVEPSWQNSDASIARVHSVGIARLEHAGAKRMVRQLSR